MEAISLRAEAVGPLLLPQGEGEGEVVEGSDVLGAVQLAQRLQRRRVEEKVQSAVGPQFRAEVPEGEHHREGNEDVVRGGR